MGKWNKLLKPGKFNSCSKGEVEITAVHLAQMVETFEPKEVKMTIGHPSKSQTSAAYGWVDELRVKDGILEFSAGESSIVPEFRKAVNGKMYPKVSAGFGFGKDGKAKLDHIAFLGGTTPAVSGLGFVEFSDEKDMIEADVEFALDFSLVDEGLNYKQLFERVSAENAELRAESEVYKKTILHLKAEQVTTDFSDWADKLIELGKVLPNEKKAIVDLLTKASEIDKITIDLAEGLVNCSYTESDMVKGIKSGYEARPNNWLTKEVKGKNSQDRTIDLAQEASLYIAEQKSKGIEVSPIDAVNYVEKKHKQ